MGCPERYAVSRAPRSSRRYSSAITNCWAMVAMESRWLAACRLSKYCLAATVKSVTSISTRTPVQTDRMILTDRSFFTDALRKNSSPVAVIEALTNVKRESCRMAPVRWLVFDELARRPTEVRAVRGELHAHSAAGSAGDGVNRTCCRLLRRPLA